MGSTTGLVSHRYLCCPLTCHVVHSTLKMRSGFLLLLVVSAILVSQSEAGLWGKAAWLAVKWARKNCHANLSGIGCKWGRKRSEGEAMSEEQEASLQTVCEAIQAHGSGGLSLEYVKDVFEAADEGDDPAAADNMLDQEEYATFMESMEASEQCLRR